MDTGKNVLCHPTMTQSAVLAHMSASSSGCITILYHFKLVNKNFKFRLFLCYSFPNMFFFSMFAQRLRMSSELYHENILNTAHLYSHK